MEEITQDGLNFNVYEKGTVSVTGRESGNTDTEIHIPERVSVNGRSFPVTEIDAQAFSHNNLTSVTIPDSVTSIDDYAFLSNDFTSVTIPDSVRHIGRAAFGLNQLTSVHIGNSTVEIKNQTLQSSQVVSITIGDSQPVEFDKLVERVGVTYENVTALATLQPERRNSVKELVLGRGYDLQDAITALELVYL